MTLSGLSLLIMRRSRPGYCCPGQPAASGGRQIAGLVQQYYAVTVLHTELSHTELNGWYSSI